MGYLDFFLKPVLLSNANEKITQPFFMITFQIKFLYFIDCSNILIDKYKNLK